MSKRLSITFDDEAFRLLMDQATQVGLEHRLGQYIGQLVHAVAAGKLANPELLNRVDALQQELDAIRQQLTGNPPPVN